MFERLILCPFAVADLTQGNANVYYELGVRHAFRPATTVQLIAEGSRLPFDIQMQRTLPYKLDQHGGPEATSQEQTRAAITKFLVVAQEGAKDSPVFQLVEGLTPMNVDHLKTDVFRDQVTTPNTSKSDWTRQERADATPFTPSNRSLDAWTPARRVC